MTSSGTYVFGTTTALDEVIVEAYERCGIFATALEALHIDSARRSINGLFADWANQQPNLWTIDQQTQVLTSGTATYALPVGTVAILNAAIRTTSGSIVTDFVIGAISRSEYLAIAQKAQTGRPTQFWQDRLISPSVYLWPTPDSQTTYTLLYYRAKMLQDVTSLLYQTADAPNRFMEAMFAGLAAKLSTKWAPERVPMLQADAARAWALASGEDRERVPLRIAPDYQGAEF